MRCYNIYLASNKVFSNGTDLFYLAPTKQSNVLLIQECWSASLDTHLGTFLIYTNVEESDCLCVFDSISVIRFVSLRLNDRHLHQINCKFPSYPSAPFLIYD